MTIKVGTSGALGACWVRWGSHSAAEGTALLCHKVQPKQLRGEKVLLPLGIRKTLALPVDTQR